MTLPDTSTTLLALLMMVGAALYTSVGHGGASAYIALLALFGVPAQVMRPTALVLNIMVSSLTAFRFLRAGLFRSADARVDVDCVAPASGAPSPAIGFPNSQYFFHDDTTVSDGN